MNIVHLPTVLVVEDNVLNTRLAVYILERAGFQVDSAVDSGTALQHIEAARPGLILMDIQLPGMDGLEFTRQLKADPATRDIVIIALTAFAMNGDEARMLAAGCDGYLAKPIEVSTFAASIRAKWADARLVS